MKIEVWFDFTCPYCFLGKKRFDMALEQFGNREAITLEFKSFELAPNAPEINQDRELEMLRNQYGITKEKAGKMAEEVGRQANEEFGLNITMDHVEHTNTFQAHRLMKYSCDHNKASILNEALFKSYFIHNEDIGDRHVLHRLAVETGLNTEEVDALLCLNHYAQSVRYDEQLAEELGISTVPFFIFNEEYAVSGAQPTEVFISVMNELWQGEANQPQSQNKGISYCDGSECYLD